MVRMRMHHIVWAYVWENCENIRFIAKRLLHGKTKEKIDMFFTKRSELVKCPKALDVCMKFLDEYIAEPKGRGRYELDNGIYCVVTGYDTIPAEDSIIEAHRKYADLHCSLSGEERVQFGYVDELQIVGYEEAKDFVQIEGKLSNELIAKPTPVHRKCS